MSAPRLRWLPFYVDGRPSLAVKAATDNASGAYAIRRKDSHGVVYVGESHVGRMWRTLNRHFQAPASLLRTGNRFATDRGDEYEVAWKITKRGKLTKKTANQAALDLQSKWIADFRAAGDRLHNADDGKAWDPDEPINAPEDDAWGGLVANPAAVMGTLGRLVALTAAIRMGAPTELVWNLRTAPILAYDKAGKLVIAYPGPAVRPVTKDEAKDYRRTHWGQDGRGEVLDCGASPPPRKQLGELLSIVYATKKGADSEITFYEHEFGEGGPRAWKPPFLYEHRCDSRCGAKCAASGSLFISGGTYRVTARGIVG